jgi:hypothetical protein
MLQAAFYVWGILEAFLNASPNVSFGAKHRAQAKQNTAQ